MSLASQDVAQDAALVVQRLARAVEVAAARRVERAEVRQRGEALGKAALLPQHGGQPQHAQRRERTQRLERPLRPVRGGAADAAGENEWPWAAAKELRAA